MVRRFTKKQRSTKTASWKNSAEVPRILQERAYHIWVNKGRPNNSALENWLEAKKQLNITE